MKIGIVSDGKFGDRAYANISRQFPCEWILVPYSASPVMDDVELDLPACDLFISYARHPDVALGVIDRLRPVILAVSFGPGFLRQAKGINEHVVAPVTMCSLEDTTGTPEIDRFARVFGRPLFELKLAEDGILQSILVKRGSPCGSTVAASAELAGQRVSPDQVRHFGLRICHFCRAPRLGRTCDKELSGLLHVRELVKAIDRVSPEAGAGLQQLADEIEDIIERKMSGP